MIARGPVSGLGTLTPTDGDTDTLVFADGTLLIQETGSTFVQPPSPPLCVVRFTTTGNFEVVGGTGRFTGAAGGGSSADSGLELVTRTAGGCSEPGLLVLDKVEVRGTVTLS